ncbi:hypothetical protein LSAT2_007682 [Lamellibrachia satsuma]|nr:hypothetical protein LSAT2_007682 [Lamellibrachia satsuma]
MWRASQHLGVHSGGPCPLASHMPRRPTRIRKKAVRRPEREETKTEGYPAFIKHCHLCVSCLWTTMCIADRVIVLTPSSYFLGEALMSRQFPLWYYSKFYIGCVFSGVLGVFLNLLLIHLENGMPVVTSTSVPCVTSLSSHGMTSVSGDQLTALGKMVTSLLSMLVFEITLTSSYTMWILVNLATGLVYASCSDVDRIKESNSDYETQTSVEPQLDSAGLDMIRMVNERYPKTVFFSELKEEQRFLYKEVIERHLKTADSNINTWEREAWLYCVPRLVDPQRRSRLHTETLCRAILQQPTALNSRCLR